MSFTNIPDESKSQINKAGDILKSGKINEENYKEALKLADKWRASHAYPINTFQATLRNKLKDFSGQPIAAQRLKRMSTIIDKLNRHPNMQLTTMQDIGGVRAIVESINDVYKLADYYKNKNSLVHELYKEDDYILAPRDSDGYRSLHLMYKYINTRVPDYDGSRVELQIRTRSQHVWATAVETMGTFLGQALKSRQGDQEWLDFFAIVSSAFACIEKTNVLPKNNSMSKSQIFDAVKLMEKKLNALEIMQGFSVAANAIPKRKGWSYHLIVLDSTQKTVRVKPYNRDELKKAVDDYTKAEALASQELSIEPVLVSAGRFNVLRQAYPNFFLDVKDFCKAVTKIIQTK